MNSEYVEELEQRMEDIRSQIGMKEREIWDLTCSLENLQMELDKYEF